MASKWGEAGLETASVLPQPGSSQHPSCPGTTVQTGGCPVHTHLKVPLAEVLCAWHPWEDSATTAAQEGALSSLYDHPALGRVISTSLLLPQQHSRAVQSKSW